MVAQVAEGDLRRIRVGQDAEVELPALALKAPATVESLSPRVDADSRRMQMYLALGRKEGGIDGLRAACWPR